MPTRYFCDWHGGEITPSSAYYVHELRVTNLSDYASEPTVSLTVKGSQYPKSENISTHDSMVCSGCAGKLRTFINDIQLNAVRVVETDGE